MLLQPEFLLLTFSSLLLIVYLLWSRDKWRRAYELELVKGYNVRIEDALLSINREGCRIHSAGRFLSRLPSGSEEEPLGGRPLSEFLVPAMDQLETELWLETAFSQPGDTKEIGWKAFDGSVLGLRMKLIHADASQLQFEISEVVTPEPHPPQGASSDPLASSPIPDLEPERTSEPHPVELGPPAPIPLTLENQALIDRSQRFIEVDPEFARSTGYSIAELMQIRLSDLIHPAEALEEEHWFTDFIADDRVYARREWRLLNKSGKIKVLDLQITRGSGADRWNLGVADMTAERMERMQMQENRDRLAAFVENTGEMVFSLDTLGRFTLINHIAAEVLEKEFHQRARPGDSLSDLLPGSERQEWKERMRKVLQGQRIRFVTEFENGKRSMEMRWYPVISEEGLITGLSVTGVDISDRIQKEKELKEARDKAEEATRAKSEFLAVMSHEIRTPLNGLIGVSELLRETTLDKQQQEYADIISMSADSLLQVISDILDFSKIEARRLQLESEPFRLSEPIQETLVLFQARAREKKLELRAEESPSWSRSVSGDKTRLRQILMNLVSNAIKFTDRGSVSIHLTADQAEGGILDLHFSVRDTGAGLSREQADKLFNAFSQADASTYRKFGGTGLGLAICKNLVELMNGRIWVESSPGEGSRFDFTVRLPEATTVVLPEPSTPAQRGPMRELMSKEFPLRILLTEDNDINRLLAGKIFSRLGYNIATASNGLEAVDAVQQAEYDLVFMDVQMPECDGLEATRRIRSLADSVFQPVIIAMTAFATSEDRDACLASGMNDYLSKPITLHDIETMIQRWAVAAQAPAREPIQPKEEQPSARSLLDQDAIGRLMDIARDTDPGFLKQVIDMFSHQAPQSIRRMKDLLQHDDLEVLSKEAHKLKGTSLNIGARQMADTCRLVEQNGKKRQGEEIGSLLLRLDEECGQTLVELNKRFLFQ